MIDEQRRNSTANVELFSTGDRTGPFSAPVLLANEDEEAYQEILAGVTAAVAPRDILEQFWVEDFVTLVWEARRLRRARANLVKAMMGQGLMRTLELGLGFSAATNLAQAWFRREPQAVKQVEELLSGNGLTMDAVMAKTMSLHMADFEKLERMIGNAESRRNAVLREVHRHRKALAKQLRREAQKLEEAEFADVRSARPKRHLEAA